MGIVTFGPVESATVSGSPACYVHRGRHLDRRRDGLYGCTLGVMFAQIMAVFSLMSAVFSMFAMADWRWGIGQAILAGVLLWYLVREQTVAAVTGSDGHASDLPIRDPTAARPRGVAVAVPWRPALPAHDSSGPPRRHRGRRGRPRLRDRP